ncbi:hypothetical protein D3C73_1190720 [compost metagenome]
MHCCGTGFTEHPNDGALRVATDDRVINYNNALATDDGFQSVELEPDTQLAQRLRRLDERAAHVRVLDEAVCERDAGLLCVSNRRGGTGLGNRNHEVCLMRVFAGQLAAHLNTGLVHGAAGDGSIRAGEVDVLEDTAGGSRLGEALRTDAVLIDGNEFAGLDLADEARANGSQAGLL